MPCEAGKKERLSALVLRSLRPAAWAWYVSRREQLGAAGATFANAVLYRCSWRSAAMYFAWKGDISGIRGGGVVCARR